MHWLANSGFLIFVPVPISDPCPMPPSNYGINFAAQQKTWISASLHQKCCDAARAVLGFFRVANSGRVFMLHVLYLVHDVSDPAVRRRIIMLKAGGAQVT
ncbi:MAG: hypothetical protein E5X59_34950, partial [Mesorhizobium sp.]